MKSLFGIVRSFFSRMIRSLGASAVIVTGCSSDRTSRMGTPASRFTVRETSWPARVPGGADCGLGKADRAISPGVRLRLHDAKREPGERVEDEDEFDDDS